MTELAGELGRSVPDVSDSLKEMSEAELVISKQQEGDRRKYYALTDRSRRIVDLLIQELERPLEKAALPKAEAWRIDACLKALDSSIDSEDIRLRLASAFLELCRSYRVWENPDVMKTFKRTIEKPEKFQDKVGERFRSGLKQALHHMMEDADMLPQVMKDWYERILKNARDAGLDDELRAFFISLLDTVYQFNSQKRRELIEVAFQTCFEQEVGKESKTYEKAREVLYRCLHSDSKPLRETIFNRLLGKATSLNSYEKEKAEDVINPFISALAEQSRQAVKDYTGEISVPSSSLTAHNSSPFDMTEPRTESLEASKPTPEKKTRPIEKREDPEPCQSR